MNQDMKIIGVDMGGKSTSSFALSNGKQAWILPDAEPAGAWKFVVLDDTVYAVHPAHKPLCIKDGKLVEVEIQINKPANRFQKYHFPRKIAVVKGGTIAITGK